MLPTDSVFEYTANMIYVIVDKFVGSCVVSVGWPLTKFDNRACYAVICNSQGRLSM